MPLYLSATKLQALAQADRPIYFGGRILELPARSRTPPYRESPPRRRRLRLTPLHGPGFLLGGVTIPAERQRPAKDPATSRTGVLLARTRVTGRPSLLGIHR